MKLTKVQNKYINNKKTGFALIKGGGGVGKTTALIFRLMNLENNYCIYEDDQILFLSKNTNELNSAEGLYKEYNNKNQFYSLFSLEKGRAEFNNIEQLIQYYCNQYLMQNDLCLTYLNISEAYNVLENPIFKVNFDSNLKRSKLFKNMTLNEIYDEILWIKACGFTKEEYISCDRKGRQRRINRNSIGRELIYSLLMIYNNLLISNGCMDIYDKTFFAIKYSRSCNLKYSHILVDDIQDLTKAEIKFIESLYKKSSYSSINFAYNNEVNLNKNNWLIKGRRLNTIGEEFKGKGYLFKKEFDTLLTKGKDYIDKYQYIDFKHKNISEFNIDTYLNTKEIYLQGDIKFVESELLEVPVFNDIAAGNPIEINDNIEEHFYLPEVWLERGKNIFILHVKGDSMIGKNINDGDLVVIKNQQMAYHNDIVAASIDGEATLKILNTNEGTPSLIPANDKYSPITLEDKEVSIIGVALGVIKHKN